jgi:ribosome-associated protein
MIRRAAVSPKFRVKTKPTKASQERRIRSKVKRGTIKKLRREKPAHD